MYTRQKDTCRREGTAVSILSTDHHQCTLSVPLVENKIVVFIYICYLKISEQSSTAAHLRYRRDFVEACSCRLFNLSHTEVSWG